MRKLVLLVCEVTKALKECQGEHGERFGRSHKLLLAILRAIKLCVINSRVKSAAKSTLICDFPGSAWGPLEPWTSEPMQRLAGVACNGADCRCRSCNLQFCEPLGLFPDSVNSERGAHPLVKAFNSSSSPGWSACAGAVSAQDAQNRRCGGSGSGVFASIIDGVSESFNLCQCRPSAFLNVAGFPEDMMSVIIVKCFMPSSCQMLHVFLTLTLFACMDALSHQIT